MTDKEEQAYEQGERAAYRAVLGDIMRGLAGLGVPVDGETAIAERMDLVASLRRLCGEHGDNDWPDNLHLPDVIEKHLMRHVAERLGRTAEQERADVIAQIDELARIAQALGPELAAAAYAVLRRVIVAGDHVGLAGESKTR